MAFYIPAYVVKQYQLDPTTSALVVPMIFEIGGLIGGLAGGFAGDLIGRVRPAIAVAIFGISDLCLVGNGVVVAGLLRFCGRWRLRHRL